MKTQQEAIPTSVITPDSIETRLGTLNFKDGIPDSATAQKLFDEIDYVRAPLASDQVAGSVRAVGVVQVVHVGGAGRCGMLASWCARVKPPSRWSASASQEATAATRDQICWLSGSVSNPVLWDSRLRSCLTRYGPVQSQDSVQILLPRRVRQ